MKKIAIVLVVTLSTGMSEASQDKDLIQKKHNRLVADEYTGQYADEYINMNDANGDEYTTSMDEYTNNGQNQCTIDEYDQQVCDTAQPQAMSNTQLMLTSLAGKLLIYYLSLQQAASSALQGLTHFLSQWFKRIS